MPQERSETVALPSQDEEQAFDLPLSDDHVDAVFTRLPEVRLPPEPVDPDDPHGYRTSLEDLIDDLAGTWILRDDNGVMARVRGVINEAGDLLIEHEYRSGTTWYESNLRVVDEYDNPNGFLIVELPSGDSPKRRRSEPRTDPLSPPWPGPFDGATT
jgi:hypothetical protein